MSSSQDQASSFQGGEFAIVHRDTNSILRLHLDKECSIIAKPGVMISMSSSVSLQGSLKFSMKKLLIGGEIATSTYTGPGDLELAPAALGDISYIVLSGREQWMLGKDAFLSCTEGVIKDYKRQKLGKAIYSGEGLYTYSMTGTGIVWITSFGAILTKELGEGETYTVDNGHLVAWTASYALEYASNKGAFSTLSSGEGYVCKFKGPGVVCYQSRNAHAFASWLRQILPA